MSQDRRRRWEERHGLDDAVGTPSRFVVQALDLLGKESTVATSEPRRALDLACGRGRHALLLAERGYLVDAVDWSLPGLVALKRTAAARELQLQCLATDVASWPLPAARYALVIVVNFLDRSLFESLRTAVAPGGALLYETHRRDERSGSESAVRAEFLLSPGELDDVCRGWRVLIRHEDTMTHEGKVVARAGIVAQRPAAASETSAH